MLSYGFEGDAVTVSGGLSNSIEFFDFADGTTRRLQDVLATAQADCIVLIGRGDGASYFGAANDDQLTAASFDRLYGGRGNDTLTTAGQAATLHFAQGDGHDLVRGGGYVTYEFDQTVGRSDLVAYRLDPQDPDALTPRDLVLQGPETPGSPDTIIVQDDALSPFRSYEFVDGAMTHIELLERSGLALEWVGTDADQSVAGTRNADRLGAGNGRDTLDGRTGDDNLDAGAGADHVLGGAGNDILRGASGNDTLDGGTGDDRYVFDAGDGLDVVIDSSGSNVVEFSAGVSLATVGVELLSGADSNLYLSVRYTATDSVLIRQNFGQRALDGTFRFRFSDGSEFTSSALSNLKIPRADRL